MKRQYMKSCIIGSVSGLIISIIGIGVFLLAYLNISDCCFDLLFGGFIVAGFALSVMTLLYKTVDIKSILIRFFFLLLSYVFFYLLFGNIGLLSWLMSLLNVKFASFFDGISGLMVLTYMLVVFLTSVITIIVFAIFKLLKRLIKKY